MAGLTIAVVQQKGGVGKTTIAAHLAGAAAEAGRSAVCLDIDPQGSLSAWGAVRDEGTPKLEFGVETVAGHRARDVAERHARSFDVVVIDAPPHGQTEALQAMRAADVILIPLQPSPLDLWATRPTIEAAAATSGTVRLVFNRTPARGRIVDETAHKALDLGVPALDARIGARVAFPTAMARGLTVLETEPRSVAAEETRALGAAVFGLR